MPLLAALLLLAGCGARETMSLSSAAQPITQGELYEGDPSVGLLIIEDSATKEYIGSCTATVVGKLTVLTAAHCLVKGQTHLLILEQKKYPISQLIPHPDYDPDSKKIPPDHDIGVAILGMAAELEPMAIALSAPQVGMKLTLVGYGVTEADAEDAGEKRKAVTTLEQVAEKRFSIPADGTGNVCTGDSGGPVFTTIDGQRVQLGITSASEGVCGKSRAWATRVDAYLGWLEDVSGGDLRRPDASPPQVKILSPAPGAAVQQTLQVEVAASDDIGVVSVSIKVDGEPHTEKQSAPFIFDLTLQPGSHAIETVARDAAGNEGTAEIDVEVRDADLAVLGTECEQHYQCESGVCSADGETAGVCTKSCTPALVDPCPEGFSCGGIGLCLPEPTTNPGSDYLAGGCSVHRTGSLTTFLLLLGLIVFRKSRLI